MDRTTHGTARLNYHGTHNLTARIGKDIKANAFVLGSNIAPFEAPPTYKPLHENWMGEPVEVKGERIETPDYGIAWNPSQYPGMALTFGYAGSGKGGLLIPAALTYGGSMVLNDPKGELAALTGERRKTFGKVANCDPFGEVQKGYGDKRGTREPAMRYNPLAALRPTMDDFAERVATVAEALAIERDGTNALFSGTGRDLIEGVIAAEATLNPGRATLREVRRWLTQAHPAFAAVVSEFLKLHPSGLAASKLRGFADMENRTNQSTLITAKDQTKFLDNDQIIRFFEPAEGEPTFSFDELSTGTLTVYVVLPGRLLGSYSGFSRLLFNQALEAVQRVRQPNMQYPVTFLIDEAGTSIGKLESIEQAYGLARGAGMVLWSFYQDLPQLKRDYPRSFGTFVSNSACVTVTGARDEETCEYLSKYLGVRTIPVIGSGTSSGQSMGGSATSMGSVSSGTSQNTGSAQRPVMFPDEIRAMDPADMLVLMPSSMGNYKLRKLVYYKDYRFADLYRSDPKYTAKPASPYPRGPFARPTIGNDKAKRQKTILAGAVACVVLALFFVVVHGFLPMMLFVVAGFIFALKLRKPRYGVGDWKIQRHENGVGYISGIPEPR